MEIRKSTPEDILEIMNCIDIARQSMRENGNLVQWTNGYPSRELILESIKNGFNFLIINDNEVVASFDFIIGNDPNYSVIENGAWINEEKYALSIVSLLMVKQKESHNSVSNGVFPNSRISESIPTKPTLQCKKFLENLVTKNAESYTLRTELRD